MDFISSAEAPAATEAGWANEVAAVPATENWADDTGVAPAVAPVAGAPAPFTASEDWASQVQDDWSASTPAATAAAAPPTQSWGGATTEKW